MFTVKTLEWIKEGMRKAEEDTVMTDVQEFESKTSTIN